MSKNPGKSDIVILSLIYINNFIIITRLPEILEY